MTVGSKEYDKVRGLPRRWWVKHSTSFHLYVKEQLLMIAVITSTPVLTAYKTEVVIALV